MARLAWLSNVLFGLAIVGAISDASGQTNLTVNANTRRFVGGTGVLERERYFNHWGTFTTGLGDLREELVSPDGLNIYSARETFELDFFSSPVPEDPNRPGFFEPNALRNAFQSGGNNYRNYVLNGERWASVRDNPNPIFVQAGRANVNADLNAQQFWPEFISQNTRTGASSQLPLANNGAAYAELLNIYLEEVVYGTGPGQGYLPIPTESFHLEIINEPHLALQNITWQDAIDFHRTVTETVKAKFPQVSIGGASAADALNTSHPWFRVRELIDQMADWDAEFDYWTIHPYEGYLVNANGQETQITRHSPGHLSALFDLYETHSNNVLGEPKQFAVTEYGTFIFNNGLPNDQFGDFSLAERQWVNARDTIEKLHVFLDRPDRILTATPFIAPQFFDLTSPTPANGAYNNIFIRDENGDFVETILGSVYRLYNDVRGDYVEIENDNLNLQSVAFRDGNTLHILLNNLQSTGNAVDLSGLVSLGDVTSATLERVFFDSSLGEAVYQTDIDVTNAWQNLNLVGEEGAVLTLTLDNPGAYQNAINEETYYGDRIEVPIGANGITETITIPNADTTDALSAAIRVAYNRPGNRPLGEGFQLIVNGTTIDVPAVGDIPFDDRDQDLITRLVEVPLSLINDGDNTVFVDFFGSGGSLVAATLLVDRSIGDFNDSGIFDSEDLELLFAAFGPAADERFDLVEDGVIDDADVAFFFEQLRGVETPDGDASGDGIVNAADYVVNRDIGGGEFGFSNALFRRRFGAGPLVSSVIAVPEPSGVVLAILSTGWLFQRRTSRWRIA